MRSIEFCCLQGHERIDLFLKKLLPHHSRAFFQDLIVKRQVLIQEKPCESDSRVQTRDEISVRIPDLKEIGLIGSDIPLTIIYEDDDLLVIDKPAGMVVHPTDNGGHLDDTLVNALIHHCGKNPSPLVSHLRQGFDGQALGVLPFDKGRNAEEASSFFPPLEKEVAPNDSEVTEDFPSKPSLTSLRKGGLSIKSELRPGIVHRLDKDTSGLIVVAKNDQSLEYLAKQWEDRSVEKEYIALVAGTVKEEKGAIEAPIGRSVSDRKKMAVRTGSVGRDARTEFTVMQRSSDATLLKVNILTGRTHQIRVHFASIGHPVVGDRTYGNAKTNQAYEDRFSLTRQFLHAHRLVFKMPSSRKEREFTSPLPEDLRKCLPA